MEQQPASIFLALQESALGLAMRNSPALYPAVEILHIIGFVIMVGSIVALDLRVLGFVRAIPIRPMAQLVLPLSRVGFLLAIAMGFLLFSADASHVVRNPAFQAKLVLIVLALTNVVYAHAGPWRRIAEWGADAPGSAKVWAGLSIVLWLGVVCAGRLIAYL